ncbi:hypothetical protein VTP01DRAFT_8363 [Rhizomucor pusillus]|uniref:uncharacterized protein n=1 Tax=Rhizomucor pusillus TaxID=4840 RepID=UPI003743F9C4
MKHIPSFRHSFPSLHAVCSHGTSGCPSASAADIIPCKQQSLNTSPSSHTIAHYQQQQQRRSYSCDISPQSESCAPLTEANLKYHTNRVASSGAGRYKKSVRVELYVFSQRKILALEAELERQRLSESKAFVPLDASPDQPVVPEVFHHVNKKQRSSNSSSSSSSSSKKKKNALFSWLLLHHHRHRRSSSPSLPSSAAGGPNNNDNNVNTSSSSFLSSPSTTTSPQQLPPLSPSYSQYRQEKMALIEQGLSNTTTAVLGMSSTFASVLFTQQPTTSSSSSTTPKRDSGVSFFAAARTTVDSKRKSSKQSSASAAPHLRDNDQNSDSLIAYRYPKMVHLQTLREAAIHALSSDIAAAAADETCCTSPAATEHQRSSSSTCCCASL